jgi:hypothetical protein
VLTPLEIRYEGTVVGKARPISGSIAEGGTLFLATLDPLPVGTKLEIAEAGELLQVRVVRVSEGLDNQAAGMIVRAVGASESIEIPPPPPASAEAPAAPPMVAPAPAVRAPASSPSSLNRPLSSFRRPPTPSGVPPIYNRTPTPGSTPPFARAPIPGARPAVPMPGRGSTPSGGVLPPQNTVKGEITISPSRPITGEINIPSRPASGDRQGDKQAVPEPIAAETSANGTGSSQIEISGLIETGGSTADLPSLGGNGANKRRRSRRTRR